MPQLYFIAVCAGSSLDQHSNNVSLFNLVEQLNVPPAVPPPPGGLVPLEMHAYFVLSPDELGKTFEVRFVMLAAGSGLETFSETFSHRSVTPRYRTRTLGLPYPPVTGQYELRVDWRLTGHASWKRGAIGWPLLIVEATPTPRVTH